MGPRRRARCSHAGFVLALALAAAATAERVSSADPRPGIGGLPFPAAGEVAKGASEAILEYVAEREALQTHARRRWPLDETRLLGSTFLQTEDMGVQENDDLGGTLEEVATRTQGHASSPEFYHRAFADAAVELDRADDHGKLVAHLTQRLSEVAGKVNLHTPHTERLAALKATGPVLLQLAHVAKSPVAFFPRAADRHSDEQSRCFACIYLLQRAATNTAPYTSAAAMNYGPEDLSRQFRDSGKAPAGMPVEFPDRSAYPENRAPFAFQNGPFDAFAPGGAKGVPFESLRRRATGPSSAAPPEELADDDGARARHLLDPKLWPELDYSEDGGSGSSRSRKHHDSSLLQAGWGEPKGPIDGLRWGPVPPEAYILNSERPPIGPRVLPPVPQAPTEVEQKFGKPGETPGAPSFMTRADMDKPFTDLPLVMALPQDLTGPPPLAPQALVRAIEAGDFVPPPRPMVPGLSTPAKTNLGMLEAPAMDMDVRSFDELASHNDPLAPMGRSPVIPMLLQTQGMPDEARGTVPGRPDSTVAGSVAGERTSLSESAAEVFDAETALPAGPSPNIAHFGGAGAGKSESPESGVARVGAGLNGLLGGFKAKRLQRKMAKADPDSAEFRKPWGELELPKIVAAQKRRSAQQPGAPSVGPFKSAKDMPFGTGWDGGDGGERFDNPQDIAMITRYVAKKGGVPPKLDKAMPKGKDALHLPQTNPEAGLFGELPRTERDSVLSRPKLLSDSASDFVAAGSGQSLLQEQASSQRARASAMAGRRAARSQARLSSEATGISAKDSAAVARGTKNFLLFAREKKRPLPHFCRKGEKLCRQRLRSLTPYAMRRKVRRLMHRQRMDALMSAWGLAITQLCTVNPPLGQPLPPRGDEEDSGAPFASVDMVGAVKASLKQVLRALETKRPELEAAIGPINLEALMRGDAAHAFANSTKGPSGGASSSSILKQLAREARAFLPTKAGNKGVGLAQKQLDALTSLNSALTSLHKALKAFDMWNKIGLGGDAPTAAASATGLGKHAQEALARLANLLLHRSAFESLRTQARVFDKEMEGGYSGARPPPRLQSDGLDSSGRVTAQPFSSWVTEPNRFGDKPAVGQMPDLGLPTLIQQYCGVIKERLDLLTDAYLHGFDMEEMCGIANMCGNKRLGIYLNNEPTTVKARAFQAIAG